MNTQSTEQITQDDERWRLLLRRDRRADGAFFYGVKTTGIYCRPGCASRLPKRENVEFFASGEQAEQAGYRPCRRCRPQGVAPGEAEARLMAHACQRIAAADNMPSLNELAAEAGLSPAHFQRRFKAVVGVTPKQYAQAHRAQRFRQQLQAGNSVTEALYEAGYGSSGRAYEHASATLGMTPSNYRRGAPGLAIRFAVARCFLGWVLVAATERGICAIELGDAPEALVARLRDRFPKARLQEGGADFAVWIEAVIALIEAPERGLALPLDIQGSAFQQRVWQALREIAPGTTVSYAELAQRLGKPKAARAVARACATNKIAVAIPCHRVVRGNGELSGYRWGIERKRKLLEHEAGRRAKQAAQAATERRQESSAEGGQSSVSDTQGGSASDGGDT